MMAMNSPCAILLSSNFISVQDMRTTPPMLNRTAMSLVSVKRSPELLEGKIEARQSVKRLEVELSTVINAASPGTNAN